ncbi:ganglioside GM2 activator-like [Hydra vulgaris]|uniref:Ganglioside GM2 activator-like n=1 Tax=Hydra vulgaris TaxID=6087 RepID=A0ABM4BWI2_HYDVU
MKLFCLVVLFVVVEGAVKFENCHNNPHVHLKVDHFPDVLHIKKGHNFKAKFGVTFSKELAQPLHAKITLEKKVAFLWVPIPCINKLGSCEYVLTCDELKRLAGVDKLPYPCPAPIGTISNDVNVIIPEVPSIVQKIGTGSYNFKVELSDHKKNKIACVQVKGLPVQF